MKRIATLALATLVFSGCASVFNDRHQSVYVDSDPKGAKVTATKLYRDATTPTQFSFAKGGDIKVRMELDGYVPQEKILDREVAPSFWANFLCGWAFPVCMTVDFATGAMYNYQPEVQMKLEAAPAKEALAPASAVSVNSPVQ